MKTQVLNLDSTEVHWCGRVVFEDNIAIMDWPAVQFEFMTNSKHVEFELCGKSLWEVYLDDQLDQKIEINNSNSNWISHKINLHKSEFTSNSTQFHHIKIIKISENQENTVKLSKLTLDINSDIKPIILPQKKIEFIGDSFVVGYGNTSEIVEPTIETPDDHSFFTTNAAKSFSYLVSQGFKADYQVNAFSGRGLANNYDKIDPEKLFLDLYKNTLVSDFVQNSTITPYDFKWQPDLVVVNLGINDFQDSNSNSSIDLFIEKYQELLNFMRSKYNGVKFLLCATRISPKDILKEIVQELIKREKELGHDDLNYFEYNAELTGFYYHPSDLDHQKIAQEMIAEIKSIGLL